MSTKEFIAKKIAELEQRIKDSTHPMEKKLLEGELKGWLKQQKKHN